MTDTGQRIYPSEVIRWVDGDTVDLKVDLGFRIYGALRFRLVGINTPERGQPGWAEAVARVNELAPPGAHVMAVTRKDGDKYGRWLAIVSNTDNTSVNGTLVGEGLAVPYMVPKP